MKYLGNIKAMNQTLAEAFGRSNAEKLVTFPLEITLTLLLKCNYRCSMCYQKSYEGELDWSVIERIEPLLPFANTLQLFGGEPLLYQRITELFDMAHRHGCVITTISNGSLLSEEMCQKLVEHQVGGIKFSIDAGTAATYKRIRGGDFAKVMAGVERISELKLRHGTPLPVMDFNFLAMRSNLPELPRLLRIASSLGVRAINVFYPGIHKEALVEECVFFDQGRSDDMLRAAADIAGRLGVGLRLPLLFSEAPEPGNREVSDRREPCLDPWTKLIVGVDGEASLCCAGPTAIGNLGEAEFTDLWNGQKATRLRRLVNTSKAPAYCWHCGIHQGSPREAEFHLKTPELLAKYGGGLPG
jgi:MoaA/NifB/PqqE/SkfB family radical SAM enzyme